MKSSGLSLRVPGEVESPAGEYAWCAVVGCQERWRVELLLRGGAVFSLRVCEGHVVSFMPDDEVSH